MNCKKSHTPTKSEHQNSLGSRLISEHVQVTRFASDLLRGQRPRSHLVHNYLGFFCIMFSCKNVVKDNIIY